jgi:hypothetical protein
MNQQDPLPEIDTKEYKKHIDCYWEASRANKNGYKYSRYLVIILGPLVTLITSLIASEVLAGNGTHSHGTGTSLSQAGNLTPDEQHDPVSEMEKLHELILVEGINFCDRLVGVSSKRDTATGKYNQLSG